MNLLSPFLSHPITNLMFAFFLFFHHTTLCLHLISPMHIPIFFSHPFLSPSHQFHANHYPYIPVSTYLSLHHLKPATISSLSTLFPYSPIPHHFIRVQSTHMHENGSSLFPRHHTETTWDYCNLWNHWSPLAKVFQWWHDLVKESYHDLNTE